VCDAVAPVPVAPSPQVQAYDAIVPSGSDDALALTDAERPLVVLVKLATGSWFGVMPLPSW
jgi:hypothetical protein